VPGQKQQDALLSLMEENDGQGVSKRQLRTELGWNNDKITQVLAVALGEGLVEEVREGRQALLVRVR
jgi:hypothetical protein